MLTTSRKLARTIWSRARVSPWPIRVASSFSSLPLLNGKEEKELATRIGQGDTRARDQMVRANLRLVVNIARGYSGKGLGLQDLIEEGNLGLLRAVEGFDPSMNTRFSTYA